MSIQVGLSQTNPRTCCRWCHISCINPCCSSRMKIRTDKNRTEQSSVQRSCVGCGAVSALHSLSSWCPLTPLAPFSYPPVLSLVSTTRRRRRTQFGTAANRTCIAYRHRPYTVGGSEVRYEGTGEFTVYGRGEKSEI
jgi:hypothetical protein